MSGRAWAVVIAGVAVAGALIAWVVITGNRWEDRCRAAGGTVETRFEGFMTVLIGSPPHPYLQPQYSDHCWVNGREIEP